MPDSLDELRALERQVEREWWWLNGAIYAVAQVQADRLQGALVTSVRCKCKPAKSTGGACRLPSASQNWKDSLTTIRSRSGNLG